MLSAKHLFGIGVLMNAVGTVLSPIAAKTSYLLFIGMRVIEGLGGVSLESAVSQLLECIDYRGEDRKKVGELGGGIGVIR
jgi:MFS family permease